MRATPSESPTVVSVNVGTPRTVEWRGQQVTSAIWKHPVDGPVMIEGVNAIGDDQADRRVHGGTDKAIYAYSVEDYAWWADTTGALAPGTFGENLTTTGIDLGACYIGDRWHVGSVVLEVAQPRQPCFKLGIRMNTDGFPLAFRAARRSGAYLRIVADGQVAAGDAIEVEPAEQPAITIRALLQDDIPVQVLRHVADDSRVPVGWRDAAARRLARADG